MAVLMIGYDLHPSKGETYEELLEAIPKLGTSSWHCLDSTWLIVTDMATADVRNSLKQHLKEDDQLLVMRYGQGAAWTGFTGGCQDWLKKNL